MPDTQTRDLDHVSTIELATILEERGCEVALPTTEGGRIIFRDLPDMKAEHYLADRGANLRLINAVIRSRSSDTSVPTIRRVSHLVEAARRSDGDTGSLIQMYNVGSKTVTALRDLLREDELL